MNRHIDYNARVLVRALLPVLLLTFVGMAPAQSSDYQCQSVRTEPLLGWYSSVAQRDAQEIADDFTLPHASIVETVWWHGYWSSDRMFPCTPPKSPTFELIIFADAATGASADDGVIARFTVAQSLGLTVAPTGRLVHAFGPHVEFEYSFTLPEVVALPKGTYWLAIRSLNPGCAWVWEGSADGNSAIAYRNAGDRWRVAPRTSVAWCLELARCHADLGRGGPGIAWSTLCGPLAEGQRATYRLITGRPNASGMLFLSRPGGADVAILEGSLVSFGGYVAQIPIRTDEDGRWAMEIPGSEPGSGLVLQVVLLDARSAGGVAFSNAVRADFGTP